VCPTASTQAAAKSEDDRQLPRCIPDRNHSHMLSAHADLCTSQKLRAQQWNLTDYKSHCLVEQFMILANSVLGEYLLENSNVLISDVNDSKIFDSR